jgi:hypothetical protein
MGDLTRSTKRAMKALQIIGENGSVDQQAEEDYEKLFAKNPYLMCI